MGFDVKVCNEDCSFYIPKSDVDLCFAFPMQDFESSSVYFSVFSGSYCMYGFSEDDALNHKRMLDGDLEKGFSLH